MTTTNPYFEELADIHVEIQTLFRGSTDAGIVPRIMARFAPRFTLVAPSGAVVDYAGLRETFMKLNGARPGSQITLKDMTIVAEHATGAVVNYREYQRDDTGNANVRRSTAVLERDAQGKVMWLLLHETFCTE